MTMIKLKLIKGRSYAFGKTKVISDKPIFETADDKLAVKLVKSGYFIAVSEPAAIKDIPAAVTEVEEIPLEKMTIEQLTIYAGENGINLTGLTKKPDILAKIKQVIDDNGENNEISFDGEA